MQLIKKMETAIKISKKAKDKVVFKTIFWLYLIQQNNGASFYDYSTFINNNPNYPRISRLRYLAEHKINLKNISSKNIIKWFGKKSH